VLYYLGHRESSAAISQGRFGRRVDWRSAGQLPGDRVVNAPANRRTTLAFVLV
jgi:hypothetical protein